MLSEFTAAVADVVLDLLTEADPAVPIAAAGGDGSEMIPDVVAPGAAEFAGDDVVAEIAGETDLFESIDNFDCAAQSPA